MRAAYIEQTGPVEAIRVGDLPRPEPGPGQVLVKVGASALNPIDLYLRSGFIAMPMSFPYIIGCDLAGTVEAVGAGTSRFRPGDRVWGSNQGILGRQGVTAEYAAVDEEWLHPTPAVLADTEAAAMALVGITAHLGLFQFGRLQPDEKVYVPGGSGGVGSMVVQMARAVGAHVMTSAGSPEKVRICKDLGAEVAVDYKSDDIPARLREFAPEGVDVWYETQREPNLDVAVPLLRKRGRMILMAGRVARPTLPLGAFYPRDCSLLGFAVFNSSPAEQDRCADDIVRWVEAGLLRPLIGRVYSLAEAQQAERDLEDNTLNHAGTLHGKIAIKVD
jgi:NADPH2:quinone reductase